jgi:hypothetical protein
MNKIKVYFGVSVYAISTIILLVFFHVTHG